MTRSLLFWMDWSLQNVLAVINIEYINVCFNEYINNEYTIIYLNQYKQ